MSRERQPSARYPDRERERTGAPTLGSLAQPSTSWGNSRRLSWQRDSVQKNRHRKRSAATRFRPGRSPRKFFASDSWSAISARRRQRQERKKPEAREKS